MKIGRVIGNVVATQKVESLLGMKLLLVQPLDENLEKAGSPLIACDTVQAGSGDIVFYEGGREAALSFPNWFNPSDCAVMGIIDQVNLEQGGRTQ